MTRLSLLPLAVVLAMILSGCTAVSPDPGAEIPTTDPCIEKAGLIAAVATVIGASGAHPASQIHGENSGRSNNMFERMKRENLAAMTNPRGDGVIVSLVYAGGKSSARSTARRSGWLVLNEVVYPIDVDAAQAFGMIWDGYPDTVKQSAGLGNNYWGMDAYGLDDFVSYNADTVSDYYAFLNQANQLCEPATPFGT